MPTHNEHPPCEAFLLAVSGCELRFMYGMFGYDLSGEHVKNAQLLLTTVDNPNDAMTWLQIGPSNCVRDGHYDAFPSKSPGCRSCPECLYSRREFATSPVKKCSGTSFCTTELRLQKTSSFTHTSPKPCHALSSTKTRNNS
ncbi:hypothetical protein QR680_011529 [Steinernema hermaphroditum]|uniref:Uncharacterized protein n=1 Tax=Steinernema hermaphroditum TaxID=289476 RepID=A0AA39LYV0_9BILA|nr:hypothetical protein QR680_011529 [Steinernema hermaphroditum]